MSSTGKKAENLSINLLRQGVTWGCRFMLGREPTGADEVEAIARVCTTPQELRRWFMAAPEFAHKFEAIMPELVVPGEVLDRHAGVRWAYRFYFGQEASEEQIIYQMGRAHTFEDIRRIFLFSREFELQNGYGLTDLRDLEVLRKFAPFCTSPAPAGFFNDFLGTKTRLAYLPRVYDYKSGTFEGGPNSHNRGMHGTAEWIGTLRSILEAGRSVVAVELGAGWAPWLVSVATAARRRGIAYIRLIGVEGSAEHAKFARQHFEDNGLDPRRQCLLHAVVGSEDGIARFPKLTYPSDHYGANATFEGQAVTDMPGYSGWEDVRCVSLQTLLDDVPRVDILHSDIQGAEADVLTSSIDFINQRVHRMVVGTHSRKIEATLLELLASNGWILEYELPCAINQQEGGTIELATDGEQVWRNPKV
jgi:FkbM family methyltransferase